MRSIRVGLLAVLLAGCGAPAGVSDGGGADASVDLGPDLHYGCFSSSVTSQCPFVWPPPPTCTPGAACEECGNADTTLCYCLDDGTWFCGCPDDSNVPAPDYCAMSRVDGDPCCGEFGKTTTCDDPIAGTRCACLSHHWSCVTLAIDAGTD